MPSDDRVSRHDAFLVVYRELEAVHQFVGLLCECLHERAEMARSEEPDETSVLNNWDFEAKTIQNLEAALRRPILQSIDICLDKKNCLAVLRITVEEIELGLPDPEGGSGDGKARPSRYPRK
jgi:hypothetical protein